MSLQTFFARLVLVYAKFAKKKKKLQKIHVNSISSAERELGKRAEPGYYSIDQSFSLFLLR